jgi:hypothetical protein
MQTVKDKVAYDFIWFFLLRMQLAWFHMGINPSNCVAWTILPSRSWSFPMGDLHDLHEDRPDLAYSAFQALGGAAIPPAGAAGALFLPSPPPLLGLS